MQFAGWEPNSTDADNNEWLKTVDDKCILVTYDTEEHEWTWCIFDDADNDIATSEGYYSSIEKAEESARKYLA